MKRIPDLIRQAAILTGWMPGLWLVSGAAAGAPALPLLTNAAQMHQLSHSESASSYPARLRGVSTFFNGNEGELYVQDETGGILVRVREGHGFELGVGQLLETEGAAVGGASGIELRASRVLLIGEGPLPSALRISDEQLAAGRPNGSRVEISGVVRTVEVGRLDGLLGLEMASGTNALTVLIKDYNLEDCRRMVDAEVSVAGVLRCTQSGHVEVCVHSMGDITVTKAAPLDAFAQPPIGLREVRELALAGRPIHRIKVSGTVTLHQPGRTVFVQEGTDGLLASSEQRTPLEVGDVIELAGFPTVNPMVGASLEHAVFRKLRSGPKPTPLPVSADQGASGAHIARLVRFLEGAAIAGFLAGALIWLRKRRARAGE